MKLIYSIILRLSLTFLPMMALWGGLFYYTLLTEISDEADDALERYSDDIMMKVLAGQLPIQKDDGSNNTFSISEIDNLYAINNPHIEYYDSIVKIKNDTEPARVLRTIFQDKYGRLYELKVSMPTFEKEDLINTILNWIIILYFILLLIMISVSGWVIYKNLQPLYSLLEWLGNYTPGKQSYIVNIKTDITEFKKLNKAVESAVNRSEILYEKQNQFIGNASHELQTPLSVIGNRIDLLLDDTSLTESQINELLKIKHTINKTVKLNKDLLLLTKIENNQFPDTIKLGIAPIINNLIETYNDIYSNKHIKCITSIPPNFYLFINESLASILISNLIQNAFVHTPSNGIIKIHQSKGKFSVSNSGDTPLNKDLIFERFYQRNNSSNSSGLGLAIVNAIAKYYRYKITYTFSSGMHTFLIEK